jgi:hypothetical protein
MPNCLQIGLSKDTYRFIEGIDVAGNYGAFYFFAPYLLNFLMIINKLLLEKGKKLR